MGIISIKHSILNVACPRFALKKSRKKTRINQRSSVPNAIWSVQGHFAKNTLTKNLKNKNKKSKNGSL